MLPNVISYNSAIDVGEKAGRWQRAVGLLEQIVQSDLLPSTVSRQARMFGRVAPSLPKKDEQARIGHRLVLGWISIWGVILHEIDGVISLAAERGVVPPTSEEFRLSLNQPDSMNPGFPLGVSHNQAPLWVEEA